MSTYTTLSKIKGKPVSERMFTHIGFARIAFSNIDKVLDPLEEMIDEVAQLEAELQRLKQLPNLSAFSTVELLKELLSRHKLFPAPATRSYSSGYVEACISIDDDHTCDLTIDDEALETLGGE